MDQYQDHEDGTSESFHEYLSAREAAESLGVKLPTLYAYTSRGLIRSVPGGKGRARRYRRADLERLKARREAHAGHGPAAAGALRFGEPVLDTEITGISPDVGPVYRGRPAVELAAADLPFEAVAEHLWSGTSPGIGAQTDGRPPSLPIQPSKPEWATPDLGLPAVAIEALLPSGESPPLALLPVLVPLLALRDPGRFVQRPEAVLPRARKLIRRLAAGLALGREGGRLRSALEAPSVAAAVAAANGSDVSDDGVRALNRALVLAADHELNASTFAARVTASTGADVYACVTAALETLSGPRHGGATARIEALVAEIPSPEQAVRVVHERAQRGEAIEGFGHPLYPRGDPRGAMLLDLARSISPRSAHVLTCLALVEARHDDGGAATMDVGLVALCFALGLQPGTAAGVFAVARCAGWVAHVLEQYEAGYLMRPRARYLERD